MVHSWCKKARSWREQEVVQAFSQKKKKSYKLNTSMFFYSRDGWLCLLKTIYILTAGQDKNNNETMTKILLSLLHILLCVSLHGVAEASFSHLGQSLFPENVFNNYSLVSYYSK